MYPFLISITMIKSIRPYIRKHVLQNMHSHEFLFLNTFFIGIIVAGFFLYKFLCDKSFEKNIEAIKNLTLAQIICFAVLAIITVASSLIVIEFDKKYNTPLINSMITKFVSAITLILISIFIFKEEYTMYQVFGMILTIAGIILITNTKSKKKS